MPGHRFDCKFRPGQKVIIADDITAVIEEVIFSRNMHGALLMVEWWHEGGVRSIRLHSDDVRPV